MQTETLSRMQAQFVRNTLGIYLVICARIEGDIAYSDIYIERERDSESESEGESENESESLHYEACHVCGCVAFDVHNVVCNG